MARSDNWRINKSPIMAIEGAQILKSIRKVCGARGLPSEYKVEFKTDKLEANIDFNNKVLRIGGGRVFTEAPLAGEKMDVLTGLAIHEVEHFNIESYRINKQFGWDDGHKFSKEETQFQRFCNIGEDIVIESRIRSDKALAEYDESVFNWATGLKHVRKVNPYKLIELWTEYGLYHKADTVMELENPIMINAMTQLSALTGWLRRPRSTAERILAYTNYWNSLKDVVMNPPKPPPPLEPEPKRREQ